MIIFSDFHHAGLLNSFILTLEKRLGHTVYRPIGIDWHTKGYWHIYDHPATVQQFLGIGGATPDGSRRLNEVQSQQDQIYLCHDIDSDQSNRAITLDGFMGMNIDVVIASIPQHIAPFAKLCQDHPHKPKLIYQVGNAWEPDATTKNILSSAIIPSIPPCTNYLQYHQEFDLSLFKPTPTTNKRITSLVNCFGVSNYLQPDFDLFTKVEKLLPEWSFLALGGQCRDGCAHGNAQVASAIGNSMYIWHTKAGGDGYGHIIHNASAMGKPLIVKKQYYEGKLGARLMHDGETCIAIDNLSYTEIAHKIQHYSTPTIYTKMCECVYNNFVKEVDFGKEAQSIQLFLDNLI